MQCERDAGGIDTDYGSSNGYLKAVEKGASKAFWEEMKFQMNLEGCKGLGRTSLSEFVKSINS